MATARRRSPIIEPELPTEEELFGMSDVPYDAGVPNIGTYAGNDAGIKTGATRGGPVSESDPTPAPTPGFDLNAWYQQQFGRAPEGSEASTDLENIGKYGVDAFKQDFTKRLDQPKQAGSGGSTPGRFNYSGPGSQGVFEGSTQQMGQDPFSQLITNSLGGILENAGQLNPQTMALRYEKQREMMDRARKSQTNQARGQLLDRNLLSVPGIPQGAEIGSIQNIEESLAPLYATSMRDVLLGEQEAADSRYMGALGLSNQRQGMLSDIALATLDRNMAWNQFLANYGLERDKVMYQLQNGQVDSLLPLINLFLQTAGQSAAGRV